MESALGMAFELLAACESACDEISNEREDNAWLNLRKTISKFKQPLSWHYRDPLLNIILKDGEVDSIYCDMNLNVEAVDLAGLSSYDGSLIAQTRRVLKETLTMEEIY